MKKSVVILGLSQTLSSVSATMLLFAVMMHSYGDSKSVLDLAWIYIATSLPVFFAAPFCGILIDRFSKKANLLAADLLCASAVLTLYLLGDRLHTALLFFIVFVNQLGISYQGLTNQTLIVHFFNKEELSFVNGWMQFKKAFQKLIAPALGGYLYSVMPLKNMVIINISSLSIALLVLAWINLPARASEQGLLGSSSKLSLMGFRFILGNPQLLAFAGYFTVLNFLAGIHSVLYTPVLLNFADEKALGLALSIGSGGMILGGLMSAHIKRLNFGSYRHLLLYSTLNGLSEVVMGSYPGLAIYSFGLFLSSLSSCFIAVCQSVLWQSMVPQDIQGRVFGARDLMILSSLPVGMAVGGILGDACKQLREGFAVLLIINGLAQIALAGFQAYRTKIFSSTKLEVSP
jgi:MFS family permease